MTANRGRTARLLLGYAVAGVLAIAWQVAGKRSTTGLFPAFTDALSDLVELVTGPSLWADLLPSAGRALAGFALGSAAGCLAGVAIGYFRGLEPWVRPALEFLRAVPPPALLPVAVLAFGATSGTRIAVIAAGAVWPVLLAAVDATRGVEPGFLDVARINGLSSAAILRRVILPATLPAVMAGMRTALGISLIMMVISEMIASTSGLGYVILQAQRTYAISQMYAGIIVLGVLGWLVSTSFSLVERRVLSWYQAQKGIVHD